LNETRWNRAEPAKRVDLSRTERYGRRRKYGLA
jgi:transcriptional regulator of acetoin/glycerol metabolism